MWPLFAGSERNQKERAGPHSCIHNENTIREGRSRGRTGLSSATRDTLGMCVQRPSADCSATTQLKLPQLMLTLTLSRTGMTLIRPWIK